jgi:tryptophan synthase alpha chain
MNAPNTAQISIADTFEKSRVKDGIAFMPFISAGYPSLAVTAAVLPALEQAGADLIEIGIPFSDPVADGPTIQQSYTAALATGVRLKDIFATIAAARPKVSIPLVCMVSYSMVYRQGVENFCRQAKAAGFDAILMPDLPPPEARQVCDIVRAAGLDTVLLVAPTTAPERRGQIAKLCSGFVYYLSVSGITGERTELPKDLADNLRQLRKLTDRPVCVGFGISQPHHVQQLKGHASGAIVGSAIVKHMIANKDNGTEAIVEAVGKYCRDLLAGVR